MSERSERVTDVRSWPVGEPVSLLGEHLPDAVTPTVALVVDRGAVVKSRLRADGLLQVWTNGARSSRTVAVPADFPGADVVIESRRREVGDDELARILVGEPAPVDALAELCGWEADGLALVVVDTGPRHPIAERELAARADDCEKAAAELGLDSLGDAGLDAVMRCSEPLRPLVRHVITERARIHRVTSVLERRDWPGFGQLLTSSHASLRDDLQVSAPDLDHVASRLLAAGALGARLTGPGFGGELIALVPADVARRLDLPVVHPLRRSGPDGS